MKRKNIATNATMSFFCAGNAGFEEKMRLWRPLSPPTNMAWKHFTGNKTILASVKEILCANCHERCYVCMFNTFHLPIPDYMIGNFSSVLLGWCC